MKRRGRIGLVGKVILWTLAVAAIIYTVDTTHSLGDIRKGDWQAVAGTVGKVSVRHIGRGRGHSLREELGFHADDGTRLKFSLSRFGPFARPAEWIDQLRAREGSAATAYVVGNGHVLARLVGADGTVLVHADRMQARLEGDRNGAALAALALVVLLAGAHWAERQGRR